MFAYMGGKGIKHLKPTTYNEDKTSYTSGTISNIYLSLNLSSSTL